MALNALLLSLLRPQLGENPMEQLIAQERVRELGFALCVLDQYGVIVDANPAFYSLLGVAIAPEGSGKSLLGSSFAYCIRPEFLVLAMEQMQRALAEESEVSFHCRLNAPDKSKKGPMVWVAGQSRQDGAGYFFDCMLLQID